MSDIVIQAENLGKHDTTGRQAENGRDVALRALKDVRLEIRRGEFEPNDSIIEIPMRIRIFECVGLKSSGFANGVTEWAKWIDASRSMPG